MDALKLPASKEGKKRTLYNLTLHAQTELTQIPEITSLWDVEIYPRLRPVKNPQEWREMKYMLREALKGIPLGSYILIGGMSQLCVLLSQLNAYVLCYIKLGFDGSSKPTPIGIDCHETWNRQELYDIKDRH